jgi:transcriptional regulator with XRE-family HTH domain
MSSSGHKRNLPGRPLGQLVDGERIRQRRNERGLTRDELAQQSGLNARTIARAETEHGYRLSAASIRELATALSISELEIVRDPILEVQKRLRQVGLAAPAPPEPWVERPDALDWIRERFSRPSPRACCLAGPSGIGKTALARYVARALAAYFPHGVVWLMASRQGRPVDALQEQLRIAEALELRQRLPPPEPGNADMFAEALVAALREQRRLLVLDDVVDTELLRRFHAHEAGSFILATTHLLHVAERFGYDALSLGSMDVKDTQRILTHHLGEERVRGDQDGVLRLHKALGGIPRSIHIAGQILQRERLVGLSAYAGRIVHDPAAGQFPDALRSPATSLMASFAQIQPHVSPEAWALLGVLSVFDEVPFSLAWARAAAGTSRDPSGDASDNAPRAAAGDDIRAHLSELLDIYLVTTEPRPRPGEPAPGNDVRCYRLESHVTLFARGVLGEGRGAVLAHLARHAALRAWAMRERGDWDALSEHQSLWNHVLGSLLASVFDMDVVLAWDGVQAVPAMLGASVPGQNALTPADTVATLVDIALDFVPHLEREPVHHGGQWLHAAAACALALHRHGDAGRLLLALGRWWLRAHVDLNRPIAWFDTAADLLARVGNHALASAAVSEAGRALFGCQRPLEGLARFERAIVHARQAFDTGTELACRLSSAAASFTRAPGLEGWQRAADLLEQAVAACTSTNRDGQLMRVACVCNLAAVRFVLDRAVDRHTSDCDAIAEALAAWQAMDLDAPIFEARLLSLHAVLLAGENDTEAAGLRARAVALWRNRLMGRDEPTTEDFLWQLGEAAFYLRLYLASCAEPGQGMSPVIAQGFALSDISRELPFESGDLVPMAFLFPVAPLLEVFAAGYIAEARQAVEAMYGPENRILEELRGVEELRAVEWIAPRRP